MGGGDTNPCGRGGSSPRLRRPPTCGVVQPCTGAREWNRVVLITRFTSDDQGHLATKISTLS